MKARSRDLQSLASVAIAVPGVDRAFADFAIASPNIESGIPGVAIDFPSEYCNRDSECRERAFIANWVRRPAKERK